MQKLNKEQAIVLTGFTGVTCCDFGDFHEEVEKRLGYGVFTHQFGNEDFMLKVKELFREDFIAMVS